MPGLRELGVDGSVQRMVIGRWPHGKRPRERACRRAEQGILPSSADPSLLDAFGAREDAMFDEMERLLASPELVRLLDHYAQLGSADREVWQDRLMELEAVEAKQLSRLHGELIAFGWVEMNTSFSGLVRKGAVPGCYRVTSAGIRAARQARSVRHLHDEPQPDDGGQVDSPSISATA